MGFWGPIRKKLGVGPEKYPHLIAKGFGVAVFGTVWVSCIVLLLSNLFVGKYGISMALAAAVIVGGIIFRKLFRWYVDMLIERTEESIESDSGFAEPAN